MNIGRNRHRVSLQSFASSQDAIGHPVKTWTTYATVWASITPISGGEREAQGKIDDETTHILWMRYDSSNVPTPKDRILYGSRVLEINAVLNYLEKNEKLELRCKEVVS